jgi:hypothetical protein
MSGSYPLGLELLGTDCQVHWSSIMQLDYKYFIDISASWPEC